MQPKISVIVTVYNSEEYIEECIRSLMEQTLDFLEYIIVNDASTDNSINIINSVILEYPNRLSSVRIFNLEKNRGVAHARQLGIENASGEYIIHTDSDDWVDNDMYERLYQKAKDTNADIVGCNFRHEFSDKQYDFLQQYSESMDENISRLICGKIFPSLCTSLTRRTLIEDNKISFTEGLNMGEDLFFNLQLYLHAKKIVSIDWAPYHYRHTENSSCIQRTHKSIISDITIAQNIEQLMKSNNLFVRYSKEIEFRKFYAKLPLVQDLNDYKSCMEWKTTFQETNKNIWQFRQLSIKQRLELWLIAKDLLPLARIFKKALILQNRLRSRLR